MNVISQLKLGKGRLSGFTARLGTGIGVVFEVRSISPTGIDRMWPYHKNPGREHKSSSVRIPILWGE